MPGCRVKVRFAGQDVDGFVVERADASDHDGPAGAAAAGGQRRAGAGAGDRDAVGRDRRALRRHPLRRAAAGRAAPARDDGEAAVRSGSGRCASTSRPRRRPGRRTTPARAFVGHLAEGGTPRAVWTAAPGDGLADRCSPRRWPPRCASGRGALVCTPDHKDVARVVRGADGPARRRTSTSLLTADERPGGPLPRLPRRRPGRPAGRRRHPVGRVRAGPRPRAGGRLGRRRRPARRAAGPLPPHPRGAAAARRAAGRRRAGRRLRRAASRRPTCCAPAGPTSSSPPATRSADGSPSPSRGPPSRSSHVTPTPEARESRRRPTRRSATGWSAGRSWCRRRGRATPRRWPASAAAPRPAARLCSGPLRADRPRDPAGLPLVRRRSPTHWTCAECGHRGLRAPVLGDARTAEELGRTFPQTVVVRVQRRHGACRGRPPAGEIVVATPGAEPVAAEGLRRRACCSTPGCTLARADLRTDEEALRRWLNAAALVRAGRARWSRSATPATRRSRRWSAGTRPGSPSARSASAARRTCRPRPGWPP